MLNKSIESLLPKTPTPLFYGDLRLTQAFLDSEPSILDSHQIYSALKHLCAELSLCEQILVFNKLDSLANNFSFENYFTSLNYTHLDHIKEIKDKLSLYPTDFINWTIDKKLNIRDFQTFIYDYKSEVHQEVFKHLSSLNLSKNSFIKIIDFYFDLCASKKIDPNHPLKFNQAQSMVKSLEKMRFQKTLEADETLNKKIKNIQISKQIKIKSQREGDTRNLITEIKAKNPTELKKQTELLLLEIAKVELAWENK